MSAGGMEQGQRFGEHNGGFGDMMRGSSPKSGPRTPSVFTPGKTPSFFSSSTETPTRIAVGEASVATPTEKPKPKLGSKPTQSNADRPDKEHRRRTRREETHAHRAPITIMPGRRYDTSVRGSAWPGYLEALQGQNAGLGFSVLPRDLVLNFLSRDEMHKMLAEYLAARDGGSVKDRKSRNGDRFAVRDLAAKMNTHLNDENIAGYKAQMAVFNEDPELGRIVMERSADPDNVRWFKSKVFGFDDSGKPIGDARNELSDEARRSMKLMESLPTSQWMTATFEVSTKMSKKGPSMFVELSDEGGVLTKSRNDFVDIMSNKFGLDTTGVSEVWVPTVEVFIPHEPGNISGIHVETPRVPPAEIPFKGVQVYQMDEL